MLKLKDAPDTAPVITNLISLVDARGHVRRGNYTLEDDQITLYTAAAYDYIRQELKRAILPESWTGFTEFPSSFNSTITGTLDHTFPNDFIDIGYPGVTAVASVKFFDVAGDQQTIDPSDLQNDLFAPTSRIHTAKDFDWPETEDEKIDPVEVKFTMGWAAADVPDNITSAIKLMLSYLYDNRNAETVAPGYAAEIPLPKAVANLIERWRSPVIK